MIWRFYIEDGSYNQTLIENPVGWESAVFKFKRDRDLHGIFFEYSIPLKFHGVGYDLIKAAYVADGVEAYLRVVIEVQCTPDEDFEEFYVAKLNFTKIQFQESDVCFVEMVLEDDSCLSMFNNRQDIEVELQSLDTLDGQTMAAYEWINKEITLPSKTILKTDEWLYQDATSGEQQTATRTDAGIGLIELEPYLWVLMPDIINEMDGINEDHEAGESDDENDITPLWIVPDIPGVPSPSWVLSLRGNINLQVTATLSNLTLDGCGTDDFEDVVVTLTLRRYRPSTSSNSYYTVGTTTYAGCHASLNEDIDYTFSGAFPVTVTAEDEISLYWNVAVSGTYSRIVPLDPSLLTVNYVLNDTVNSFFKVTLETNFASTQARVSLVNEALSRITESITNKCLRVYSDYFGRTDAEPYASDEDGCGALEAITNGLLIRRNDDASHKMSFKKLFDGLNAIHNIGIGIEDDPERSGYERLRIEQASYFYSDTVILTCDKVPNIRRTVITDEHYSIAEFGYLKWEAEEYNGLDEFNTTRRFRTSLKNVRSTLSKLSNLIASGYAIEITRQQYSNTSKDWRYDNDDFIICMKRDGYTITVEQGNIDSPANIIDPDTVYNFRITPARNAIRWLNKILASYVDPANGGSLYFMSGTGNTLAEGLCEDGCVVEAGLLSEQEPEITADSASDADAALPLYKLESWEFDYPLSFEDYNTIRATPTGIVRVRYGQQEDFVDTFVREIEYKPNQGIATFRVMPVGDGIVSDFILQENGDYLLQEDSGKLKQD